MGLCFTELETGGLLATTVISTVQCSCDHGLKGELHNVEAASGKDPRSRS